MKADEKETYMQLSLYEDNLLSSEDRERVEAHLNESEESRERLDRLRRLDDSLHLLGSKDRVFEKVESNLKRRKIQQSLGKEITPPFLGYRYLMAGATAAVFLIVFWFTVYHPAKFELLTQTGEIAWADGSASSTVPQIGDRITSGKDSFAMLRMADGGSIVEIGPQTDVSLLESRKISIERGVVYHHVSKNPNSPFQAITPFGTVTVLGTVFEIEVAEKQAWVRVKEGTVRLEPAEATGSTGNEQIVKAGFESSLQKTTASVPNKVAADAVAPWRTQFRSSNLDIHNIAEIISDSPKK